MNALVYLGPGKKALQERQKPDITLPTDAIVRVTHTTMCGTDHRLEVAKRLGATAGINSANGEPAEAVMKMTGGRGVDTAIEAVGIPQTFELCEEIVAPGGTIANIGVHGTKVDLHLEHLWDRNITITTRLVDTVSTPMLLDVVRSRKVDPALLITHRFTLDHILDAYDTAHAADTRALKVILAAQASDHTAAARSLNPARRVCRQTHRRGLCDGST